MSDLLAWLWEPGDVRELRALGRGTQAGYFDTPERLQAAAEKLTRDPELKGVYATINPCLDELLGRACRRVKRAGSELTKDHEIVARRVLLVDCDPPRPAGINSSEAEHQAALDLAARIRGDLTAAGWPLPARVDTGNGGALWYPIDLPADDAELLKNCLWALAARYDGPACKIDLAVHNPSRIARVPGTLNRKGDDMPERPQRPCRLLELPGERVAVPRDLLEALAATRPAPEADRPSQGRPSSSAPGRPSAYDRARAWLEHRDPAVEGAEGDKWTYITACTLVVDFALSDQEALELLRPWNETCRPPWTEAELLAKLASARKSARSTPGAKLAAAPARPLDRSGSGSRARPSGSRPGAQRGVQSESESVQPVQRELPQIVIEMPLRKTTEQALNALLEANQPPATFRRGSGLVRIRTEETPPTIEGIGPDALLGILDRCADWYAHDKKGDGIHRTRPDKGVAADLLALPNLSALPPLDGFAFAPFFTREGHLVQNPGYDRKGRVWYYGDALAVQPVSSRPTDQEVMRAHELLLEPLHDFPFADETSRTHLVAMMLLSFGRDLIDGPTPLHLLASSSYGSGKGKARDVAAIMATGKEADVTNWPMARGGVTDESVMASKLWAMILRGTPMVALDNVPASLDSSTVAAMVTASSWTDRVLGGSTTATCPVRCTWCASAINPALSGENARRSILIRLEPDSESPWERTEFRHANLLAWTREHRADLIWAALTCWSTWLAKGRPRWRRKTMGSFEVWCEVMGSVLELAGFGGFLDNREDLWKQSEQELPELRALAEGWYEENGDNVVAANKLLELCKRRNLLQEILGSKKGNRVKILGHFLRKHNGRVVAFNGIRVKIRLEGKDRNGVNTWSLTTSNIPASPQHPAGSTPQQESLQAADPEGSAGMRGCTSYAPPTENPPHNSTSAYPPRMDMDIPTSPISPQESEKRSNGAASSCGDVCRDWGTCEDCGRPLTSPHGGTGMCASCLTAETRRVSLL